jgi:hypothetical protein
MPVQGLGPSRVRSGGYDDIELPKGYRPLDPGKLDKIAQGMSGVSKSKALQQLTRNITLLLSTSTPTLSKEERSTLLEQAETQLDQIRTGLTSRKGKQGLISRLRGKHRKLGVNIGKLEANLELLKGGGRLDKRTSGYPNTIIVTKEGKRFELLNTISLNAARALNLESGKKVLGKGSFGKVRLARNLDTGEVVAVKKIVGERGIGICKEETKTQAELARSSEHVLDIHGSLETKNSKGVETEYIFMDLAKGCDGFDLIRNLLPSASSRFTSTFSKEAKETLHAFQRAMIDAVLDAHEHGVAHCDLKPENTIVTKKGELFLIDFGFSMKKDESSTIRQGTRTYAAPEIASGHPYSPEKADLYALGVSLVDAELGNANPFKQRHYDSSYPEDFSTAIETIRRKNPALAKVVQSLCNPIPELRIASSLKTSELYTSAPLLRDKVETCEEFAKHQPTDAEIRAELGIESY